MSVLFATDQVAGAEYICPLVEEWREAGRRDWTIVASPVSAAFLKRHAVPHRPARVDAPGWFEDVLDDTRPEKALLSTSIASRLECGMRRELRRRGIPCAQLVDSWVNFRERFGGDVLDLPDAILAPDELARSAMIAEGIPPEKIVVVGQPALEQQWLALEAEPQGLAPGDRVLVITQPVSRFFGKTLGYDEDDFLASVLSAVETLGWSARTDVLVHPAESLEAYRARYAGRASDVTWRQNTGIEAHRYAHAVGMFSTLLFLAVILGIRTTSCQPGAIGGVADKCFLSARGVIPRVRSTDELVQRLASGEPEAAAYARAREALRAAIRGSRARLGHFMDSFGNGPSRNETWNG